MKQQQLNIITIDLEEWFHINDSDWVPVSSWAKLKPTVEQNTLKLLGLLRRHNQKATFFTLGWMAERYPELIRQIRSEGHELGYHSYYHLRPMWQSAWEFEVDLQKGLSMIASVTGEPVHIYRAPNLSLGRDTLWIIPLLIKNGITISSSLRAWRSLGNTQVPNQPFYWQMLEGSLLEFPLNRIRLAGYPLTFTGSGYFRVLPYGLARNWFKRSPYNVAYFHPNDIDPNHPVAKEIGWLRNYMNRVGTRSAYVKIDRLLSDFRFITLTEASRLIHSHTLQTINPKEP